VELEKVFGLVCWAKNLQGKLRQKHIHDLGWKRHLLNLVLLE